MLSFLGVREYFLGARECFLDEKKYFLVDRKNILQPWDTFQDDRQQFLGAMEKIIAMIRGTEHVKLSNIIGF